jgi:hypothetical protein
MRSGEEVDVCCGNVAGLIMEVESELCDQLLNLNGGGGGESAAQGEDSAGLSSALQADEQSRRAVKFADEIASPRADHALDNRPESRFEPCGAAILTHGAGRRRRRPTLTIHPPETEAAPARALQMK